VDIDRQLLQRWSFQQNEKSVWELPSAIGSFALRKNGGCIVALRTGFAFLDFVSGHITHIIDPEPGIQHNRFNDGKCDRQGRVWAGTMDEEFIELSGALYRLDSNLGCKIMREKIGIYNGLGWSPANDIFYYTDSGQRTIWVYDFDSQSGMITNE
jgi:L-arabinonolactonase